ncbi:MAG TPA: hypothetical protein VGZ22_23910 [Isosphaeraceae bacterium]|jgi:hypothetical protein|nr:hypothetical protein [Isosphaeraceae bacterium]
MKSLLGFGVSVSMILFGVTAIARPDWLSRFDKDHQKDTETPPAKKRREMRISGIVVLALGICLLVAVLQDDGSPLDAVLF